MTKICITNVSVGRWHPAGQTRLLASLAKHGYDGATLMYRDEYPPFCPSHQQKPYAFKPHAFKEAFELGNEIVIWMDAAVWANKPIQPLIEKIEQDGYFFPLNGWTNATWTNDNMLSYFGITRDQAAEQQHMMACVMGLDMRNELAYHFYRKWFDSIEVFPGAWTNKNKECSQDERCEGHRHDQSAASIIAHHLGMKLTTAFPYLSYNTADDCILLSQGM